MTSIKANAQMPSDDGFSMMGFALHLRLQIPGSAGKKGILEKIKKLNGLDQDLIVAGQELKIPIE